MTNPENLPLPGSAGSSLAARVAGRLNFPVASLSDALQQLGANFSGIEIRKAAVPGSVRTTLAVNGSEAARLEHAYFPLESEQQLAEAIATERRNFRPAGNWLPPA